MQAENCCPSCSTEQGDIVIIGAGLAGLYTALCAAESGKKIILLAKSGLDESNTDQAQGGIAAPISDQDSPLLHLQDTLSAGAGLCDPESVSKLVEEGQKGIQHLIELGVQFDKNQYGLALTREGAHSKRRILHARGDATGREIRETLSDRIAQYPNVIVKTHTFALDLITGPHGCSGVTCLDAQDNLLCIIASEVVIASGGACQMYENTTNPRVATGDGIAMAWRLGVPLTDFEFVQFHPTALQLEGAPRFLISEAVRGEGAILLNTKKERFMPKYSPQAELSPRDVVARAMVREMEACRAKHLWLDISAVQDFPNRFPTIYRKCTQYGLNLPGELIPVAPAAHYFIGGIITDDNGRTDVPGLYACGEASCTGVHGANRLASNSLLEALVYGGRIAKAITESDRAVPEVVSCQSKLHPGLSPARESMETLRQIMWNSAGLSRERCNLEEGLKTLETLVSTIPPGQYSCRSSMELMNMATIAQLLIKAALLREESRGGHYRSDFPQTDPRQRGHWVFQQGCQPYFTEIKEGKNAQPQP